MLALYEQFKRLTIQEQQYMTRYPYHALVIKKAKEDAYNETQKQFGFNGHNDETDAFRHCFWSALLARDLGYTRAREFTSAHESFPGNNAEEKEMDLYNNRVGLDIGRIGGTNQMLSCLCMIKLRCGKLKVLK